VDDECAHFAALVRPAIDRVFSSGRFLARDRVQAAYDQLGLRPGFELSFYFGLLARPMSADGFAAAATYGGADMSDELAQRTAVLNADGSWQLTELGREAAFAAQRAISESAEERWAETRVGLLPGLAGIPVLAELAGRLLTAGLYTGGPAFRAMVPVFEPDDATPAMRLMSRLGALRHHRADAHRSAWAGAGLTLQQLRELDDPHVRASIEDETNRLDGPIYQILSPRERLEFLAGLAALPG
jgi:hypothetical protein